MRIVRDIGSPIVDVFRAWTDPGCMTKWLAPDDATVTSVVADVREGGRFRIGGRQPGGASYSIRGTYLAVDAPNRLEMSWRYDGSTRATEGASTVIAEFMALEASSTRLTLTHERAPAHGRTPGAGFAARMACIVAGFVSRRPKTGR